MADVVCGLTPDAMFQNETLWAIFKHCEMQLKYIERRIKGIFKRASTRAFFAILHLRKNMAEMHKKSQKDFKLVESGRKCRKWLESRLGLNFFSLFLLLPAFYSWNGWGKTLDWIPSYSSTGCLSYLWMHLRLEVILKKATYSVFNLIFTAMERESYW